MPWRWPAQMSHPLERAPTKPCLNPISDQNDGRAIRAVPRKREYTSQRLLSLISIRSQSECAKSPRGGRLALGKRLRGIAVVDESCRSGGSRAAPHRTDTCSLPPPNEPLANALVMGLLSIAAGRSWTTGAASLSWPGGSAHETHYPPKSVQWNLPRPPPVVAKVPTGIQGLDDLTGGGLPRGRATLLCGGAGCGNGSVR